MLIFRFSMCLTAVNCGLFKTYCLYIYAVSQKSLTLACYYFDIREWILNFFGRNVEEFLLRLRCSPLYINMHECTSLWGAMAF